MSAWHGWFDRLRDRSPAVALADDPVAVLEETLERLSIEEWLLLVYCVDREQQTIALDVVHPAAGALVAKGLLIRSGTINHGAAWPYTVSPPVWKVLRRDPDLLHRLRGIPRDDPQLAADLARLDKYLRRFEAV